MRPLVLLLLLVATARADQLQWNSRADTDRAVQVLSPGSLVVSYCSEANLDHVEVWRVIAAVPTPTVVEGYWETQVFAKRLLSSKEPVVRGTYREPLAFARAQPKRSRHPNSDVHVLAAVDFAYVYVRTGDNVFVCLGRTLGLPCEVSVDTIRLSASAHRLLVQAPPPRRGPR